MNKSDLGLGLVLELSSFVRLALVKNLSKIFKDPKRSL